MSCGY